MRNVTCKRFSLLFAFLVAALAFAPARADVAVIQPSQQDSYVDRANTKVNYGTDPTMSVGRGASNNTQTRSLVQFDISSIPAGATINSATLELYAEAAGTDAAATQDLYDITEAWVETGVTWQAQPANSGTVRGSLAPGTSTGWKIWTVTASVVQGWLDTPATNYGLLVRLAAENQNVGYWLYATRENGTAANHPILRVDYTVAGCAALDPAVIESISPNPACDGDTITFTAQAATGGVAPYTYDWDFEDGTGFDKAGLSVTNVYGGPNTYTVRLRITDSCATPGPQTQEVTDTVTVNANPTAAPTVNPDPVCQGTAQTFTANPADGSGTYTDFLWDFGNAVTSTLQDPTYIYPAAGSYTVTVTVTDDNGCKSAATGVASNPVVVNANPTAAPTAAPDPACEGVAQTFTANDAGGDTYLWDFGDLTTSTLQDPTHTYAGAGSYTVTLTVTDSVSGCTSGAVGVATNPVDVVADPTAAPTVNFDPVCQGTVQTFTANGAGGDTYLWDFGDLATSTLQDPTHTYAGAGSYTVTLTVTDSVSGCTSGAVGVATNPVDVVASPTAAPTAAPDPACEGVAQTFAANDAGGDTYLWDFGDLTTSTLQSPTHTYAGAGSYTVTVTVTDSVSGCTSGAVGVATNPVDVVTDPTPTITPDPAAFCTGSFVTLDAGDFPGASYAWTTTKAIFSDPGDTDPAANGWTETGNGATSDATTPDDCGAGLGNNILMTKSAGIERVVDTTGYSNIVVRTDWYRTTFSKAAECVTFQYSLTGGAPWTDWYGPTCEATAPLNTWTCDQNSGVLPAGADDNASFAIRFNTTGSANGEELRLDQIIVEGDTAVGIDSRYYDASAAGTYTVTVTIAGCSGSDSQVVTENENPEAAPTVNLNPVCQGTAQTFTANPSKGSLTYTGFLWDFGNAATSTLQNPTYIYPAAGSYTATVTVTDDNGCKSAATGVSGNPVVVNALPTPTITESACDVPTPGNVTLDAGGGYKTYEWSTFESTQTIVVAGDGAAYDVTVTDFNDCKGLDNHTTQDCGGACAALGAAVIESISPNPACDGDTITFTAKAATGGVAPYTYDWDFEDGTGFDKAGLSVTNVYGGPGPYTVRLLITDSCATPGPQTEETTAPVTVNENPEAGPTVNLNPVCQGTAQTFTANPSKGSGPYTFLWDFGNAVTSTLQDPTYTYPSAGSYTVTVTVTDDNGCESAATGVSGNPVVVDENPEAAPTVNPDPVCQGTAQTFTANPSKGSLTYTDFLWDFGNAVTSTLQDPTYTYPAAGSYTVTVTVTDDNGCKSAAEGVVGNPVVVNALPTPTITESACDVPTPGKVTLDAGGGYKGYEWSTLETTQTIEVDGDGTAYDVTVTDFSDCEGSDSHTTQDCAPTVTVTPTNLASGGVTQGEPGVAMERLAVAINFGTASWTKVKVDLYTTTSAADGDIAAVKVYDDAGATTVGSFDIGDGDSEIGSGTFSGGTVTITFGAPQTVTTTTSYFYVVFDIACAPAVVGNNVGIRIVDETYFTMDEAVSSANMPFNSLDSLIIAPVVGVTPTDLAPASVQQGDPDVAMERMEMATNYCSVSWTAIQVDLYTTGVAFDTDVTTDGVQIYDDTGGTPGSFDGTDVLIGQGTYSGGTVAIALAPAQVITTASKNFFIVYDIDAAAVVGHKVGIRIADGTYFTTTGTVNSAFNSTDSEILTSGGMVPDQVMDFDASDGDDNFSELTWTNPPDPAPATLTEIMVRRRTDQFPVDNTDGTEIYQNLSPVAGAKDSKTDATAANGTVYYYAVFGKSSDNEWNDSVDAGKNADTGLPLDPTIDYTTSPTVLMLSPVEGSVVGGTVTIKISAYDADGLASVELSFDGTAWPFTAARNDNYPYDAAKSTYGTYEYPWDTTATVGANAEEAWSIFYRATDLTTDCPGPSPCVSPIRVVTVTVRNSGGLPMGDGMLLRRANDAQLCIDCHALATHTSELLGTKYGPWAVNCRTCHTPHNTRNIYLIRERIKTPSKGYRDVLFKALTGTKGDDTSGVLADETDSVQTNLCEVCHTQTKYHLSDGSIPNPGHKNAQDCTSCHPHADGFKASGGDGGADCDSCHSDLTGALGDNAAKYHHYLQNFSMLPYPTQAQFGPGDEEDTDRRCIMCHADHDIFSPDINTDSPGRSYNLRTNIGAPPVLGPYDPKTSGYTNTDFDNTTPLPDGGICTSCHQYEQTKNTTKQADDGTTKTPAINIASYDASAHDYATPTSTFTDSSTFEANCSRCHIDDRDPKSSMGAQSGSPKFGLHDSRLRRLVSDYGDAGATDPFEEGMCYKCHTASDEFYGVVAMSAGAKGIEAAFGSTYNHPVDMTSGVHLPYGEGEAAGWNPKGSRHVECGDCHDPHVTQAGNHTPGAGGIGNCNLGVRSVTLDPATVASDSTFRSVAYTGYTDSPTQQYQICLLCHSEWGWNATPPDTLSGYPADPYPTTAPLPQTDVGKDFDVDSYAFHPLFAVGLNQPPDTANAEWDLGTAKSGDKWEPGDGSGTGLSNTFVDGWSQDSLVTCSDCHEYSDPAGPRGPHGSAYRWLLKGVDIYVTVILDDGGSPLVRYPNMNDYKTGVPSTSDADDQTYTRENFCINCHRGDVYGWGATKGGGAFDTLSRLDHMGGGTATSCMGTVLEGTVGTTYPIGCMNCHGGKTPGEIHGSTRGVGSAGSSVMGARFTNGTSWIGHNLGDDSPENIGCITPDAGNENALNTCVKHPSSQIKEVAPNYYYDYPGQ